MKAIFNQATVASNSFAIKFNEVSRTTSFGGPEVGQSLQNDMKFDPGAPSV